jgi:radical SAM protein with 4Fe4S-binding SPASM domain
VNIIKSEILWTRKCPLNCSYCKIKRKTEPKKNIKNWIKGINFLNSIGNKFYAIYGAEPLYAFEHLTQFVRNTRRDNTVITSGIIKDTQEKIEELIQNGLTSLTMSYDIESNDRNISAKSKLGYMLAKKYAKDKRLDNVALVTTVTNLNINKLPKLVEKNTANNIWTFFDFIHWDKGQPNGKCSKRKDIENLIVKDRLKLKVFLFKIMQLKHLGYKIHWSGKLISYMLDNADIILKQNWNCAKYRVFPAFVTINNNGDLHFCDDFQLNRKDFKLKKFWEFKSIEDFENYAKEYRKFVSVKCKGCAWSTHIDAFLIKNKKVRIGEYVHKI